jgi:ferredoxin
MTRAAVVGSGPAGLWCAKALIARGCQVTLFDIGERLPEDIVQAKAELAAAPQSAWPSELVERLGTGSVEPIRDIPRKLVFGSDYFYAATRPHSSQSGELDGAQSSCALGGYSVAWGGAVLPYHANDLREWPFGLDTLRPHYRAVAAGMPLSGADDALSRDFPSYRQAPLDWLQPSPAGEVLLERLTGAETELADAGAVVGRARLAIEAGNGPSSCRHCGLCLTGCPVGAVYETGSSILSLARRGALQYRDRRLVRRVWERSGEAELEVRHIDTGAVERHSFDAIFLGAGTVGTSQILLRSGSQYGVPLSIKEAPKFLLPMFSWRSLPTVNYGEGNEFATAFMEVNDPTVSPHWVHVQLSPANRLLLMKLGIRRENGRWRDRLLLSLASRLVFAWGSVHSRHSPDIQLRLDKAGDDDFLNVASAPTADTLPAIRRAGQKLALLSRRFGAASMVQMVRHSRFGASAHIGGAYPMQQAVNKQFSSDILGRPAGYQHTHIIDGAAFPSIPATTMAFTVMANAHRIGTVAPLDNN